MPPKKRSKIGPQSAGKRPRRRACDICFNRKIQCDAEYPQCDWCKHQNLACTYNRLASRNDNGISGLPVPSIPIEGSTASDAQSHLLLPVGQYLLQTASCILDNIAHLNGNHLSTDESREWIEACTGESINFDKLGAIELSWANTSGLYRGSNPQTDVHFELPSRPVVERFVQRWCSSLETLAFPVISKWLFTETLDLAYGARNRFGSDSARSCVYSFLALAAFFNIGGDIHGAMHCGSYASAAQSLVPRVMQEMSLSGLESLVILTQFQYFLGDLQAAAVSVSVAVRLLYKLNAHVPSSIVDAIGYDRSILECHLRDLFWLCYSWDKDICLRLGRPPSIDDRSCDLTLPKDYEQLQERNILRESGPVTDQTLPFYPFDLRLSKIKSEVYHSLYSVSARRKLDTDILSTIRSLDHTLEQWRISLHSDFRPTLWFSEDTPISDNLNTQAVMLRLAYHHCFTIIHQASERCTQANYTHLQGHLDGISSSISLTIHASCSTLSYLQAAMPKVKDHVFW
ncbi:transcription factor domain-containing protein [Aspergillus stella-maris]|uniref:transcription factor domain-containing protein n=1 Tax=Aspergillus stella-maris TaxID=1810926 RepID=UPI003CCD5C3F